METTKEVIQQISEKLYSKALERFYTPPNYDAIESWLRNYCGAKGIELKNMHKIRGKRDLEKLAETKSGRIEVIDNTYPLICSAFIETSMELGETLSKEELAEYEIIKNVNGCASYIFEDGDFAIMEPPIEHHIRENEDGEVQLHNENGPSILFPDGSCLYSLDDITVDAKWVETPVDEIKIEDVLAIENVDVRAVVLKRIGLEKATAEAEVVDQNVDHPFGPYRLLDMEYLFGQSAMYLEMRCPSTGKYHLEGVDNSCDTVESAITWRSGQENWNPHILDGRVNPKGDKNQRQQGDVYLNNAGVLPEGAVKQSDRTLQGENTLIRHVLTVGDVYNHDGIQYIVTEKEEAILHPEHGTVHTFAGVTKLINGREIDHITGIVHDLID